MAQLGDTIIKGDLNVTGDLNVFGNSNIYGGIDILYNTEVQLTSSGVAISLSKNPFNYNMILVRLRTGHNYAGSWIICNGDYGRNNTFSIYDNGTGEDRVFIQGISTTSMTIKTLDAVSAHGTWVKSVWGLFPIA